MVRCNSDVDSKQSLVTTSNRSDHLRLVWVSIIGCDSVYTCLLFLSNSVRASAPLLGDHRERRFLLWCRPDVQTTPRPSRDIRCWSMREYRLASAAVAVRPVAMVPVVCSRRGNDERRRCSRASSRCYIPVRACQLVANLYDCTALDSCSNEYCACATSRIDACDHKYICFYDV